MNLIHTILYKLDALLHKIDLALPAQCPRCMKWVRKGSMRYIQTTPGPWVAICTKCYYDLYPDRKSLR